MSHYDVQNSSKHIDHWRAPDPVVQQKIAFVTGHGLFAPGARIADMGCGWGEGSYHLALMNPQTHVIGVDNDPRRIAHANALYRADNLRYVVADMQTPQTLGTELDVIINSSSLHHVYSYNLYSQDAVRATLGNEYEILRPGGLIVIRDFLALAHSNYVHLYLRAKGTGRSYAARSDASMLALFARQARRLLPADQRGFFLQEKPSRDPAVRHFYLPAYWMNEFFLRIDYRKTFKGEACECYSFWDEAAWRAAFAALPGRVLLTSPVWNPWSVQHRWTDRIAVTDELGTPIGCPPTNYVLLFQKLAPGESTHLAERRAGKGRPSYLRRRSYRHRVTGEIFDVAARPGTVQDFLPYTQQGQALTVWAKAHYPRPLAVAAPRGTAALDGKTWSGHMVEPLALADIDDPAARPGALARKMGCAPSQLGPFIPALSYYPCIGLAEEAVTSVFLETQQQKNGAATSIAPAVSGFSTSGDVRPYEAQALLRSAHVGVLAEARLELNLYALMRHLDITPAPWLDGVQKLTGGQRVVATALSSLLEKPARQAFAPSRRAGGYILCERSLFEDRAGTSVLAAQELEHISAAKASLNLGIVLPLARDADGALCLGLVDVDTPAAQTHQGDSRTLAALHIRLPFDVRTLDQAQRHLAAKLGCAHGDLKRLGEAYFASIGMTRERCYPFMVNGVVPSPKETLHYVKLTDLFVQLDALRDASLMIGTLRAVHAFDLWGEGQAQKKACASKRAPLHCTL